MAITGDTWTAYRNEAYLQKVTNNIYWNTWFLNQPYFEIVPAAQCPGGASIDFLIDYSVSTNAAAYVIGETMKSPDSMSSIRAYFTKDYYSATGKSYGITRSQQRINYNGQYVGMDPDQKAIDNATKNLVDLVATTVWTDFASQIDGTAAFSDASLSRSTYSIASYDSGSISALALSDLEDAKL